MRLHRGSWKGANGEMVHSPNWSVQVKTPRGAHKRIIAFADKRDSEEFGRKLDALCALKLAGERPDAALLQWLDTLPVETLERLAKHGFIEREKVAAAKPLERHIDDYDAVLADRQNCPRHNQQEIAKIRRVFDACHFEAWQDIDAGKIEAWLAERRRHHAMSVRTSNSHLIALKGFCRWAKISGRMPENPIQHLSRLNEKVDRRRQRRPLEEMELARLLDAAEADPSVSCGLTGPARALLYRLAAETGLRWSELRSLRRLSFDLAAAPATVTVDAKDEKAGRGDTLPLRDSLAAALAAHFKAKGLKAGDRAFALNVRNDGAKMIARDLARTGDSLEVAAEKRARGEEPVEAIPVADAAGRVVDFHALRHTFGTNLARSGVHPKTAQDLMRHSSIELTMNLYTHTLIETRASALQNLPERPPKAPPASLGEASA